MSSATDSAEVLNRVIWMLLFLVGATLFAWLEWSGDEPSTMGWFLLTSIWSAVSGIGFTACSWWLQRASRFGPSPASRPEPHQDE
ncbi:MAG: hypothetical protein JSW10_04690 [Pseudomonadota bacterium]|nr:MAG: hypothetical protein JSW10_04690 [Pseudomonadota bacterium]